MCLKIGSVSKTRYLLPRYFAHIHNNIFIKDLEQIKIIGVIQTGIVPNINESTSCLNKRADQRSSEYFRNEKPFQAQLSVEPTLSWLFTSCLKRKLRCWWHICYSWSSICQARIQFTSSLTSFKARPSTTNVINFGLSWVLVESDLKKLYSMYLHNIWRNELFRMAQIICSTRLKAHHLRPHLDLHLEVHYHFLQTMEIIWYIPSF